MPKEGKRVADRAVHQPSKAELEEDTRISTTQKALAWTVTRRGGERRETKGSKHDYT